MALCRSDSPDGALGVPSCPELPRAARRALRRHRSRAGALPRRHFDHAVRLSVAGEHGGQRRGGAVAEAG
eukprot:scaffold124794_cov63-Phaeocystis_antarctica.AAC.2